MSKNFACIALWGGKYLPVTIIPQRGFQGILDILFYNLSFQQNLLRQSVNSRDNGHPHYSLDNHPDDSKAEITVPILVGHSQY